MSHSLLPKRPYYDTYWGYLSAFKIAPEYVEKWRPLTVDAIRRHFGEGRWLRVVREYSFAKGPTALPPVAETVRHTVRAADLLYILRSEDRLVSTIAWSLISEANNLQRPDGGWAEFRSSNEPSSLWSTIYVFRFLSTLVQPSAQPIPDERDAFVERAALLIRRTERFLTDHWRKDRWTIDPTMPWQEGTAAVLAEVGGLMTDRTLVHDCYDALRSLVSPSGYLLPDGVSHAVGAPPEATQALVIAFALRAAGDGLWETDPRYQQLVRWVSEHLKLDGLRTYHIAFAAAILDLNSRAPEWR